MPSFTKLTWLLLLVATIIACKSEPQSQQQRIYIFGTLLDIELVDVNRTLARRAFNELDYLFQDMHREWHAWKPGGELYKINRQIAAGISDIPISIMLRPLVLRSKQLYQISDGYFNPAMGRLIDLWGFHQDDRPEGGPPAEQAIETLLQQRATMEDLNIKDGHLTVSNSTVNLDLGGFAKGYALNHARLVLQRMGIQHAILNAGGDLCAMGQHHERPWHVGIRHPQGKGVMASLDVGDGECVMTSGNYVRYLEHEGVHYAHILDPRSGQPVHGIVSVTVIDEDGGLADAAATALTVAGRDGWYAVARRMGLKYVMLVEDDGTVYLNPGMASRTHYEGKVPDNIVISQPL
jgi:thiamine biosynthesis lipoprotein